MYTTFVEVSLSARGPIENFYCFKYDLVYWLDRCMWEYTVGVNDKTVNFIWRQVPGAWSHIELHPPSTTNISGLNISTFELAVGISMTSLQGEFMVFIRNLSDVWAVQPPSLANLSAIALNTSCVQLSWTKDSYDRFEKELYVNCTDEWREQKDEEFTILKATAITICGLMPGREYYCSVKSRIITIDAKYPSNNPKYFWWSQYATTSVNTKHDVPGSSPNVTVGGYSWETNGCHTPNNTGQVWVYWKPLDPWYYNGEWNGTNISYNTNKGELSFHLNKTASNIRLELLCNQTHEIYIRAVNDIGMSKNSSKLLISPPLKSHYWPDPIVEVEDGPLEQNTSVRYIEWSNPKTDNAERITVFYAEKLFSGPTDNVDCKPGFVGPIGWKIVNSRVNKTEIMVDNKPYCYAVAVANVNESVGIKWTACVYVKNKVPRPPENVRIINSTYNIQSGSLLVEWNKIECSTGQPYIKWYEIGTCSDMHHCSVNVRLSSNQSSLTLNQSGFPEPMVAVRAVTRFGVPGNWSQPLQILPVIAKSSRQLLDGGQIAGIVIGVFVLIFITVFLTIGVRKYRQRLYNLKVDPPKITPDTEPVMTRISDYNQNNQEDISTGRSSSEESSYMRFDSVLGNCHNKGITRDMSRQSIENTVENQTSSKSNIVSDVQLSPTTGYISVNDILPKVHYRERDQTELCQNDAQESGNQCHCNSQQSGELTSTGTQGFNKLQQTDRNKLDTKTKKYSTKSDLLKTFDDRETVISEQVTEQDLDNLDTTYVIMTDKEVCDPTNPPDKNGPRKSTSLPGFAKSTCSSVGEYVRSWPVESNHSNPRKSGLYDPRGLKQYGCEESDNLGIVNKRESIERTKHKPIPCGVPELPSKIDTVVTEQIKHQHKDEPNKNDAYLSHNYAGQLANYVKSTSINMVTSKQSDMKPKINQTSDYIMINLVKLTQDKPEGSLEVIYSRQASANSGSSKSDQSGSVTDYVTSMPLPNAMKETQFLETQQILNSETTLSYVGMQLSQNSKTTLSSGRQLRDENVSRTGTCSDADEKYIVTSMDGYFGQSTAANIINQGRVSCDEDFVIEKHIVTSMDGYIDQSAATNIMKQGRASCDEDLSQKKTVLLMDINI